MIRRFAPWIGFLCALILLCFCYRAVLFEGGQFGYRDAAHFYYPLYQKVQSEWAAGRIPLWDPSENAGMPLLGNPTAAVLYPGKLIFALFPYPWAVRLYAVGHTALAFAGTWVLLRGWKASHHAATLAGLSYAFGAPVLFQYCNIIYLVGAAWIPWGFWAVDHWVRLKRCSGLLILAVVLALQVLGGDPESAYLIGLCSAGYTLLHLRFGRRTRAALDPGSPPVARTHRGLLVGLAVLGLITWVGLSLGAAAFLPGLRPYPKESPWGPFARWFTTGLLPRFRKEAYTGPVPGFGWVGSLPKVVAILWGVIGFVGIGRWRRHGTGRAPAIPLLAGLVAAAILAGMLAAAQLLPVTEFTNISARATDEGPHDIYPFSLEPYRLIEMIWPGFYGRNFGSSVAWMAMVLPRITHRIWVPSLYVGGLTLILATGAFGRSQREAELPAVPHPDDQDRQAIRTWLLAIALVAALGSFGEFASPVWFARFSPQVVEWAGAHDSANSNAVRLDGWLRDGDGSPYCLMAALLPGFHSFRFPSKLFTFVALALAALAGLGWDRIVAEDQRLPRRAASFVLGISLLGLTLVTALRGSLTTWFGSQQIMTLFGPLDASGAVADLMMAIGQGGTIAAVALLLMHWGRRRPELMGLVAVVVMALDLGLANASIVRTIPQQDLEIQPEVLASIAAAEKVAPSPGPYRIHRMPIWNPPGWREATSGDRIRDFARWELNTIQPKYGMLHDVEYTKTMGVAELYDYEWFFSPFPRAVLPEAARSLRIRPGESIVVYPRRGFDMWNSRYFILPYYKRWDDADRGIASFLPETTRIYPPPDAFRGPGSRTEEERWAKDQDVQIFRNNNVYPRAWVVHDVRFKPPVRGLNREERDETMQELLFSDDPFWRDPTRTLFDPKTLAWIETDDQASLRGSVSGGSPTRAEVVKVVEHTPTRVVLEAKLERPGLVILADVYYPGWTLTVDGQPSTILRANRLMRGAAVGSGTHQLVYTYSPDSFRLGSILSLLGIAVLATGTAWVRYHRPG